MLALTTAGADPEICESGGGGGGGGQPPAKKRQVRCNFHNDKKQISRGVKPRKPLDPPLQVAYISMYTFSWGTALV